MDRHFLQLVSTVMGIKAALPHANLFIGCHKKTHLGSLYLSNPLLEKTQRRSFPDLPRHYQPALIPRELHEPPPPHNEVYLLTIHSRSEILISLQIPKQ